MLSGEGRAGLNPDPQSSGSTNLEGSGAPGTEVGLCSEGGLRSVTSSLEDRVGGI